MKKSILYLAFFIFSERIIACIAPTDAHVGGQNGISVDLYWQLLPDISEYEIRLYRLDTQDTIRQIAQNSPTNVGGTLPFTTYVFSVRAKCGQNEWSDYSNSYVFTTGGAGGGGGTIVITACIAPNNLSADLKSPAKYRLRWIPVTAAIEYEIEVRDLAVGVLFSGKTAQNFLEIDSLKTSGKYEFRVRSICLPESSEWSSFVAFGRAENAKLVFKITPNPTLDNIQIDLSEFQNTALNVLIFNNLGQKIIGFDFSKTHQNSELLVLESLPSGTYFLKIISAKLTSEVARFCVARR
jgi:Secretion system C-terminal sorting domain